jgi:hypothetical protein
LLFGSTTEGISMFGGNTYVIRIARDEDEAALSQLAELDSRPSLVGPVLIGEIAGSPAAALSLDDERVIADPFQPTGHLTQLLRLRARSIRALSRTPTLSARVRAGVRIRPVESPSPAKP